MNTIVVFASADPGTEANCQREITNYVHQHYGATRHAAYPFP